MWKKRLAILVVLLVLLEAVVIASTITEPTALTRLFTNGPTSIKYTQQFEAAVPPSSMQQLISQLADQLGDFKEVDGHKNPYTIVLEHGIITAYISLDGQGKVAGLQFTEIIDTRGTLADAVKKITSLDGESSVLIRKNGEILVDHQGNTPLAVGSSFKLGILAALQDAIAAGQLRWDQSVPIRSSLKSLPTGILQDWPEGTQVTIETLAALMISQSDNTATDVLLSLVGRPSVEKYLPHSIPVLSTGDMFRLKNPENEDILKQYRKASLALKRTLLTVLPHRNLPEASIFSGDPVALDIEWFMTASELADLVERLQHLDLMTINAGLATKEKWQRVAYKGGSEPGVLNLTTFLIDEEGNQYTVVVTVNNAKKALDEAKIMETYQAMLNYL